jgi:hypothetical protein
MLERSIILYLLFIILGLHEEKRGSSWERKIRKDQWLKGP